MDLLEYQAKELFREVGIPVLPSQRIDDARDLKRLQIPYPVVLKSQVRAGGRGRAGGIRFVENTIDAIAAARTIFSLPILGEYPQVILAEARYDAQKEFFLAVVQDYKRQCPVLLGSAQGGIQIEAVLEQMQKVPIEEEFSPFYARRLARQMELKGILIESISDIIEKMYQLFIEKDLDLIEINPLGVHANGEVMALDGKIAINDYALERHSEIVALTTANFHSGLENLGITSSPQESQIHWVDRTASTGVICNGLGLALATWDLLAQRERNLGCYTVLEEEVEGDILTPSLVELEQALDSLIAVKEIRVILINVFCNQIATEIITGAIADYLQRYFDDPATPKGEDRLERPSNAAARNRRQRNNGSSRKKNLRSIPEFVLRVVGSDLKEVKDRLAHFPIHWTDSLDDAVAEVVSLTAQS